MEWPKGFYPAAPGPDTVWLAAGRDIPTDGNWEITDHADYTDDTWTPITAVAELAADLPYFVRRHVRAPEPLLETVPMYALAGRTLASSGKLVHHVTYWDDGSISYHDAEGITLGRVPRNYKMLVHVTHVDPTEEEADHG